MNHIMSEKTVTIVTYVLLSMVAVIMIFPLFWMISTSLKTPVEAERVPPVWIPKKPMFINYVKGWTTLPFTRFLINSIIFSLAGTCSVLFTSSLAGFIFAKYRGSFLSFLFFLVIATMMIPYFILIVPQYMFFQKLGLVDTYPGLILPVTVNAFGVFLFRQYIFSIPDALIDSAKIDGCSTFRIYWQIILPLSKPVLAALAIFVFFWNWDNLLWPLVITNSQEMYTLSVGITNFVGQYAADHHLMMAVSTVAFMPILVVFFIFQKQFIRGIALTGMK